jgi:cell surface protein SprA
MGGFSILYPLHHPPGAARHFAEEQRYRSDLLLVRGWYCRSTSGVAPTLTAVITKRIALHLLPHTNGKFLHFHRYRLWLPAVFCVILAMLAAFPGRLAGKLNGASGPDPNPIHDLLAYAAPDDTTGKPDEEPPPEKKDEGGEFGKDEQNPFEKEKEEGAIPGGLRDSLGRAMGDSSSVMEDTTYVVFLDSTARLANFNPVRQDHPQVEFFPGRTYPLFARNRATGYRREVKLDSLGRNVTFTEKVAGHDVKVPVSIPLSRYVQERRKTELRALLAEEVRKPPQLTKKDDLGELLTNITNIQIPIPQNPILSIFGGGGINLNISGAVDIKAGFRNTKSDQTQLSVLDQSRNEPDFSQEVAVNVNGTIGDKLNILADWNTQRTFEYENQLKLKYTGYEDEIVQSVEAGNVALTTPSSFIGSSQALFGVKALFQAGPLKLTTLASQKKGEIKEVSVSGGAQEVTFNIKAPEYSTNNYFVDTSYIPRFEPYFNYEANHDPAPRVAPDSQIVQEEVWVLRQGNIPQPNERQAIAYIELPPRPTEGYPDSMRDRTAVPGSWEVGKFVRLERNQYELLADGYVGVLSLNSSVQEDKVIAIAYRTARTGQWGELSRDYATADTSRPLILKMVKPANLMSNGPNYRVAWSMLLKNIYQVGGKNLKETGFSLEITRENTATSTYENSLGGTPLLQIMGLDRLNSAGDRTPDNLFDFRKGITVSLTRAEVIFPTLRPFDSTIVQYFRANPPATEVDPAWIYSEIYDTTKTGAQRSEVKNKYVITGKATGEATSKYNLGFNVVEGSVQVLLDGRTLVNNVDYTVDYIIGEVVIRNDRALVPGANLQIKYEQNDLFQLASKTLLGARGDIALSPMTGFGFTVMNLNQQSLSDKVRLGEEPNRNTIFGFDGGTTIDLPVLTRGLDALPLLATREASNLKVSGEAAYMLPDPNTRKSPIPSDNGEGVAYIDDFEGARRSIPLGISYSQWTLASAPADPAFVSEFSEGDTTSASRARAIWFNVLPTDVRLTDVYPRKKPGNDANNQLTVLDFQYYPLMRGQFNYSSDLSSTLTTTRNWGGIMKPISISATNLVNENVNFLELWMQVAKLPPSQPDLKLIIEMGAISEDVIQRLTPRGDRFNDEDYVVSTNPNGTLQQGEDVGLDMLSDEQEQALYGTIPGIPQGDPSGDNYSFDNSRVPRDYSHINGTDRSENSPAGRIPDTEDLNSNGVIDQANSYFRYELPLNTDTTTFHNPFIVGGGNNGWFQFQIPIRDFVARIGSPSFENVEYVRLSLVNASDTVALRIADMSLVGNQWVERKKDSTFSVSVISIEDNPSYESPPGVIRERDKTRPDEEVYANEQSLALILNGVPDTETREAVKYYSFRPLDLFNYRTMKMFIHGDPSFGYVDENNYDAEVFCRFGIDSLNYYEYRAPIHPGWDDRNEMIVSFSELTSIKADRDSVNRISDPKPVRGGPPGSVYRVLGNPSLTSVRFISIGVTNKSGRLRGDALYGQVWANELRLISVDDSPGWAYRYDASLKMADLGTVAFNYSKVDPNFHTLEQRFGSRVTGTNWALNTSLQLDRFLPNDWGGTSLPVSYSHTEAIVRPKYLPGSDVVVSEAADRAASRMLASGATEAEAEAERGRVQTESESFRVTDTYAAPTLRLGFPSTEWFIRDTFNKLTLGINYTKSTERSPLVARSLSWQWTARIAWSLNFSPDYYFSPFKSLFDGLWFLDEYKDYKLFFTPASFSWSFTTTRQRTVSLQRALGAQELTNRNFTGSRQLGFTWKVSENGPISPAFDYGLQIESSLLSLETNQFGQQRSFSKIIDDIFFGDKVVNFGNDTRYAQRVAMTTKPMIPNMFNIKKYLDFTFGYSVDYSWSNQLTGGDLGKSAGFSNSISFSSNFRLKQLIDPLFESSSGSTAPSVPSPRRRGGGGGGGEGPKDSTAAADTTSDKGGGMGKTFDQLLTLFKVFIKTPLLDYDNINITFTQTNVAQNSGVLGRTGFLNFWGTAPFFQESDVRNGPSRLYQLGLISDPSGSLTNFGFRPRFPFFGWDVVPGLRAANGQLVNSYRQTNKLTLKTTRGLWEGARLDLNWSLGWSYSRTQNFTTGPGDSLSGLRGALPPTNLGSNQTITGSVERTFLTFPDVLFLGIFKSNLKQVSKRYAELKKTGSDSTGAEILATAFEEGFEALPFLRKILGPYYPRVNWSLRWDGLERLPLFSSFVTRLSLDHTYGATYTRQYQLTPGVEGEQTQAQRVAYGFTPLVGLNFTFKDLLKGSMGATLRYNSNTSYDLQTSARNIVETLTQEISITASYTRRGFEIPLFGLSLNNDIDISLSYSISKNSRKQYEIARLESNADGEPLEGTTRTVMEPRIKYILSSRVTASIYYRYTKVAPDDSGSRIPGSTVNEAGLDLHISIQ